MSESAGHELSTYTSRVAAIRTILAKHLPLEGLIQNNRLANPISPSDCLSASWATEVAAVPILTLAILPVTDVAAEISELRCSAELMLDTAEVPRAAPDEFAVVQRQLSSIWMIVGHCEVYLAHRGIAPETLIEAATEIGRSVSCAPYTDDYEPPPLPPGSEHSSRR
ncbi:hypothetical protein FR943_16745 [Mycobacterium sp. TNTM28]|uniref:Uncharacterized protein n=1 Tax=[Mycobacterium] fortunisiensis TaxID=2600579 RepID=A0ABS6KPL8_9MYCO|nr:hypothetical protein [[Mycobacterium] fortunisiensis]MBU9765490.1 hypothetical protein [[Mycobacterium] fortunisiensis]